MNQDRPTTHNRQSATLHIGWRACLGLLGGILVAVSVRLYLTPPQWSTFEVESAKGVQKEKFQRAQSAPETYCSLLLGLGVVTLCIAANGRRLAEINTTGARFDEVTAAEIESLAERAIDIQATHDPAPPDAGVVSRRRVKVKGHVVDVIDPSRLPVHVISEAARAQPELVARPEDIAFAFREAGSSNRPWYVKPKEGPALRIVFPGEEPAVATLRDNLRRE